MVIFFQDLSLLESDESINYLSCFFFWFFLSFRGKKQHIYLSSYQSSLPRCQKRHKHRERMSRRKDELMAMERSASLPFICRTLEEGTQLGDGGRRRGGGVNFSPPAPMKSVRPVTSVATPAARHRVNG